MIFFLIIGVIVSGLGGLMFVFAPRVLIYLSEISNKIFMTDDVAIKFRRVVGIVLMVVSVLMFVVAVYFNPL